MMALDLQMLLCLVMRVVAMPRLKISIVVASAHIRQLTTGLASPR